LVVVTITVTKRCRRFQRIELVGLKLELKKNECRGE
jgi:hypothetical protein